MPTAGQDSPAVGMAVGMAAIGHQSPTKRTP